MTIQLNNLTVEANVEHDRYDIISIRDAQGDEVDTTPELLDEIETAIEDELQVRSYEEAYWNCEAPHLLMQLF